MTKYRCTMSSISYIYYTTLIAEDVQKAKEMAVAETNRRTPGAGGRERSWSVVVVEPDVEGPPQIVDWGHRDA